MNTEKVVLKLTALAQDSRLRVFRLLITKGGQGLCAGDIAKQLNISPNTLSFHLKELHTAGLIQSRKDGRSIIYSLNSSSFKELLTFLTEDCCAGHPELCQPTNKKTKGCQ